MADVDTILGKVDIVDIVSEYVDLERKGKNYFGLCPFHEDSNPSMSVSTEKQLFKCFSCGAGGNAITFVMNIENISFKEALSRVGKTVGIEIAGNSAYSKINDNYFNIYLDATKYFSYTLFHTKDGEKYLNYLEKRGFSTSLVEHFKLGVSNNKLVAILNNKYSTEDVNKSNLVNNSNNLIFRNRLIFPISDTNGNVVGYSGRVIDNTTPKYLNSSESSYFKKSYILYNFFEAKQDIMKSKSIVICEGFFDVIRLYSIGVKNVVATMGTAFTSYHAKLISEVASKVYLSMDGDEAGIKSCALIYELLKKYNLKVYMVALDEDDPDEYILKYGADRYHHQLSSAKTYEEFYIDNKLQYYDELDVSKKESVIVEITRFINAISSDVTKQLFSEYVTSKIGIVLSNVAVNKQYNSNNVVKADKSIIESYYHATIIENYAINKIEVEYISFMLRSRVAIEVYSEKLKSLNIASNDEVAMLIKDFYVQNKYDKIYEYLESKRLDYTKEQFKILITILNEASKVKMKCDEEVILDYLSRIIGYKYERRIEEIKKMLEEAGSSSDKMRLLEQLNTLIHKKKNNIESGRS